VKWTKAEVADSRWLEAVFSALAKCGGAIMEAVDSFDAADGTKIPIIENGKAAMSYLV
jgi:hypothetical protein